MWCDDCNEKRQKHHIRRQHVVEYYQGKTYSLQNIFWFIMLDRFDLHSSWMNYFGRMERDCVFKWRKVACDAKN